MKTLRQRLEKEKIRLDKIALRDARTPKELLARRRWDRINTILGRRYEEKDMS